jgi:hypothetical protein
VGPVGVHVVGDSESGALCRLRRAAIVFAPLVRDRSARQVIVVELDLASFDAALDLRAPGFDSDGAALGAECGAGTVVVALLGGRVDGEELFEGEVPAHALRSGGDGVRKGASPEGREFSSARKEDRYRQDMMVVGMGRKR